MTLKAELTTFHPPPRLDKTRNKYIYSEQVALHKNEVFIRDFFSKYDQTSIFVQRGRWLQNFRYSTVFSANKSILQNYPKAFATQLFAIQQLASDAVASSLQVYQK